MFKSSKVLGRWRPRAGISLGGCYFSTFHLPGNALEVIFFFHFVKNGTEKTDNWLCWYQNWKDLKNTVFSQKIEAGIQEELSRFDCD